MEIKKESQNKMKQRLKMYDANLDEDELKELIKDPTVSVFCMNHSYVSVERLVYKLNKRFKNPTHVCG